MRQDWTLFDYSHLDLTVAKGEHNEDRLLKLVIDKMVNGFKEAIAELGLTETCEVYVQGRNNNRVEITLPDVTFFKNTYTENLCKIKVIDVRNGAMSINLSGDTYHPHCESERGDFCWNSGIETLDLIRQERYIAALRNLINVINSYYPSLAFRTPEGSIPCSFPGCKNDGTRHNQRIKHPYYTDYVCFDHSKLCWHEGCTNISVRHDPPFACNEHKFKPCPECEEMVDISNLIFSSHGDIREACNVCSKLCARCGTIVENDQSLTIDKRVCKQCFQVLRMSDPIDLPNVRSILRWQRRTVAFIIE